MGWAARKRDDWPMRRSHLTARPGRARFCAGALGLLLVSAATALPAAAQSVPPDPATKAAMDKRTAARTLMSSALGRIAANAHDARALLDAGRRSEEHTAELQSRMRSTYDVL